MKNLTMRNFLLQTVFVGMLLFIVIGFTVITIENLNAQGATAGFGFLGRSTGWDMGFSFLNVSIRDPYRWTLLMGFMNTVVVGLIAMVLSTILGVVLAVMRLSRNPLFNFSAASFVDVVRNIPPILQVFAWYAVLTSFPPPKQAWSIGETVFLSSRGLFLPSFNVNGWALAGAALVIVLALAALASVTFSKRFIFTSGPEKRKFLFFVVSGSTVVIAALFIIFRTPDLPLLDYPALKGFNFRGGVSIPPELSTILVAMTIYGSAYIAEIVRGGFLSIDVGKIEAGRALGMSDWMILSRIQLPLTLRNVLPIMTNFYTWLIKATTLGLAIGFADLFAVVVSSINQSGQTLEFVLILATAFWVINGTLVLVFNWLNERLQRQG